MNPTEHQPLAVVWQLATGTQLAALELSVRPGADDDLALTGVALALATVIDALENSDPPLAETVLLGFCAKLATET